MFGMASPTESTMFARVLLARRVLAAPTKKLQQCLQSPDPGRGEMSLEVAQNGVGDLLPALLEEAKSLQASHVFDGKGESERL